MPRYIASIVRDIINVEQREPSLCFQDVKNTIWGEEEFNGELESYFRNIRFLYAQMKRCHEIIYYENFPEYP